MTRELETVINLQKCIYKLRFEYWTRYNLFTLRWWVLLFFLVAPWFVWYALIDKRRLKEMLVYMFLTSAIAILMDEIGSNLTMWIYPYNVIPMLPRLVTANYSTVPIIYVLIYQFFPRWKSFIAANLILTLIFSLALEPILVWAKLYRLVTWRYVYSIPVYFFTATFLKWLVGKIMLSQGNRADLKDRKFS